MTDAERRMLFVAWFEGPPMNGDREVLIRKSGYSKGRISQFFDPEQQFGERAARALAEKLQLEDLEFFNKAPAERRIAGAANAPDLSSPTDDEFALVPQLDISASCGNGRFVDHVVVKGGLAFKKSSLRDFGVPDGAARIIYASGSSMEPTIKDGCVVLLNTADNEPREGRVYAICNPDGSLLLKRLVQDFIPSMGAQAWIMRSDNPNKVQHPDKILPPDDRTMIAGRAVWNDNRL